MQKTLEVTIKNTKAELFNAYQDMKERFEQTQKNQLPLSQLASLKQEEAAIIEKTKNLLPEKLEDDIISLNKKVQSNLAEMKNKLIEESGKLQEIRKAIEIESEKLNEVYDIKLAANSLQALISDFESKKEELEKKRKLDEAKLEEEMAEKRKLWEREQDEYQYQLKVNRKKEEDGYEREQIKKHDEWQEKMNKRTIEINEREESIKSRIEEIEKMKKEIDNFPKKLELAVKEAVQKAQESLQKDFAIQKKMSEMQWSSEKKMLESEISNLQNTIKNQLAEIASVKKSLSEASQRAQSLAIAVIQNTMKQVKSESLEKSEQKRENVENQ